MKIFYFLQASVTAILLAFGTVSASANPADINAVWSAIGNDTVGDLNLIQASDNTITGTIFGTDIQGRYVPATRRLVFARLDGNGTPFQVYEGHVSWSGNHLAGSFMAWNSNGGASAIGTDFNFSATRVENDPPPEPTRSLSIVILDGSGRVTSAPAGIDCGAASPGRCTASFPLGATVVLNAMPGAGQLPSFRSGDCQVLANPNTASVTMTSNKACTIVFENPRL